MIQVLAGEKGEGKTKRMLEMANEAAKNSGGHVVFIDDDNRHIYDLHHDVRFVETSKSAIDDEKIFFGFVCGILSQDGDIEHIFIDGINNIVKNVKTQNLVDFVKSIQKLSEEENVNFTMIISLPKDTLPQEIKEFCLNC